jgi:hypothetical protein
MKGKILKTILALLLVADICYSFRQHYHMTLDGDLATVVLPSEGCEKVLKDPFGFSALKGERYVATNRYFLHASLYGYFNSVPFACQSFVDPVDSLYLSSAIAKILIQVFLIWILAVYISGTIRIFKKEFLIAAVLVTPLFQTWGFNQIIGIIDPSITYTFAYALPLGLVLLYFLPLYLSRRSAKPFKPGYIHWSVQIVLAFIIAFGGPLNTPVVIIVSTLFILQTWWKLYRSAPEPLVKRLFASLVHFPKAELFLITLIIVLSIYSFYIGTFNNAFENESIPLVKRYKLLPLGLKYYLTHSIGPGMLLLLICIHAIILLKWRKTNETAKKITNMFGWILLFSLIYISLLPLGGYRVYRPLIVRYDTMMPVNLALFYCFGISILFILQQSSIKLKWVYGLIVTFVLLMFTVKDQNNFIANRCEKESLNQFAQSPDKTVLIKNNCLIMAWNKITKPYDSRWNTRYLQKIGVIEEEKYYYQK